MEKNNPIKNIGEQMELLRIKIAGNKFSLAPVTLYRWNHENRFPGLFKKVGKTLYLDETEFLRIAMESNAAGPSKRKADGPAQRIEAGVTLMTLAPQAETNERGTNE